MEHKTQTKYKNTEWSELTDQPTCSTTINLGSSMDYPELTIAPQTKRHRTTPLTDSDDKRNVSKSDMPSPSTQS